MDKKLILLLILTVTVSGCASDNKTVEDIQEGKQALEESTQASEYTVKYTDTGFEPQNLVIREGDQVKWFDRTGENVTITTQYRGECPVNQGFSSCKPVEKFSHVFDEKGKYTYHSQENLDHTATVRVTTGNPY